MREYKFRGICDEEETTHYGKWIHGYLGYEDCINPIEIVGDKDGDIEDYGIYDELTFIKVRKNTIGQFTGLHDKNGVEIYEGDIVLSDFFTWEGKCIVKFGEYDNEEQWDNARMGYGYYTEMLNGEPSSRRELNNDVIEVIGNIHEEVVE